MRPYYFHPESLMMSYGYHPEWSEGAIKSPVFQTSTFVFRTAEEGKEFFELAYGMREPEKGERPGLIYSRVNNPNLEILEQRLCLWDKAEEGAVFNSGMAAISTALLELLHPGDLLLFSMPVYGGTAHFIEEILPAYGIEVMGFSSETSEAQLRERLERSGHAHRLAAIYVETPANPTNALIDLQVCRRIADHYSTCEEPVRLLVDNTYMGPLWQHPLQHGADLVLYSATKYIGGHSDLIAGAALGSRELIHRMKGMRTFLGNQATPYTAWMLMRSLETLKVRMEKQAANARQVADFLDGHPLVESVHYLGLLQPSDGRQYELYRRQCESPGAMISFKIRGGEAEAFSFLNHLKMIKLAVSLGSTESLAQHPFSMTHAGVPLEEKAAIGITPNLVRLSIGVEHPEDLIWDIRQALSRAGKGISDPQALRRVG